MKGNAKRRLKLARDITVTCGKRRESLRYFKQINIRTINKNEQLFYFFKQNFGPFLSNKGTHKFL